MSIFNKILNLSNEFFKEAQLAEVQHSNQYTDTFLQKIQEKLSFITNKNIPLNEISQWLEQNKTILNDFNINIKDAIIDKHNNILKSPMPGTLKYIFSVIADSNKFADNIKFDIIKSGFLKGYKNIQNLYIYIAEVSNFKEEPLDKDISAYGFIYEALSSIPDLIKIIPKNELKYFFTQFINENKSKIDKILSSGSSRPKLLGSGEDGAAFDIGNGLILKIFTESYSFLQAKESFERLHKNPEIAKNEAMIYDVGILGKLDKKTIYYYIMEKMKTIPHDTNIDTSLRKIIGYIGQYIRNNDDKMSVYKKLMNDPKNFTEVKRILELQSIKLFNYLNSSYKKEIAIIQNKLELNDNWLKNLCGEIIFKYITGRGDLHLGNIGVTNYGNLVFFDPSSSYWTEGINTPSNDSIRAMEQSDDYIESETY